MCYLDFSTLPMPDGHLPMLVAASAGMGKGSIVRMYDAITGKTELLLWEIDVEQC